MIKTCNSIKIGTLTSRVLLPVECLLFHLLRSAMTRHAATGDLSPLHCRSLKPLNCLHHLLRWSCGHTGLKGYRISRLHPWKPTIRFCATRTVESPILIFFLSGSRGARHTWSLNCSISRWDFLFRVSSNVCSARRRWEFSWLVLMPLVRCVQEPSSCPSWSRHAVYYYCLLILCIIGIWVFLHIWCTLFPLINSTLHYSLHVTNWLTPFCRSCLSTQTTILYKLKLGEVVTTIPTIGTYDHPFIPHFYL